MSLANKLITITGAASGIGLSTARILASRGAILSLADYNPSKLKSAHEELASLSSPDKILSQALDVRSSASVDDWISQTTRHFGRPLDGAANVAGFHPLWTPKPIEEISDEEFDEVLQINTMGVFKCLRAQLRQGTFNAAGGSIVNVGSVSGLIGFAGDSAYVASKHAVHGITKCVSKEAGSRKIRVNAVAPGQTLTPMVAAMEAENGVLPAPAVSLARSGEPEEIAQAIVWLLSDEASYVSGSIYRVDGGMLE
jgi:NAD(P)-dependent dehydrogenase (short-subunit alcohol dehydrogenase family)